MENNILATEQTATSNLNYSGVVKISKEYKGKIISSKTFHNEGNTYLYQFISYCLGGKYKAAEELRPQYVKLFLTNKNTANNNDAVSIPILVSAITPKQWTDGNKVLGYKTTLHFLIPYTFISGDCFNEVRLYSASFTIKDELDNVTIINAVENDKKYNIIIDWELRIGNTTGE